MLEKRVYEILGIKYYRKFVLFCKKKFNKLSKKEDNDNYYLKGYTKDNLLFLREQLYKNMKIHGAGVIVGIIVVLSVIMNEQFYLYRFLLGLFVALFNLYSAMLQRYNLIRIESILKR